MAHSPEVILAQLQNMTPARTFEAPKDARGIYGLIDHAGDLRYIGSTKSSKQSFYVRIHEKHRTGSEGMSHYFSEMYNTGRMWRTRKDPATEADGKIAKALRNTFIAEYCRAVWVALPDDADIAGLEDAVIALAPAEARKWNRRGSERYDEPEDLVDTLIEKVGLGVAERAAIDRQRARYLAVEEKVAPAQIAPILPSFPKGPFRFFALDVETANGQRSSICQVGVACVRTDGSIETWVSYVNPRTLDWSCTGIHGITKHTVKGAPQFEQVLAVIAPELKGQIVYQHSGFDRSAINAACDRDGLDAPEWAWRDSVKIARQAWPELKGNGGHGLASLKNHLGLVFSHHDAGEDARAAAEVVLRAQGA
ncbi:3'-5' exonuclease [Sinisalibacter lacisalsi]|uniref:Exonuclease domain-containing protein n=1 Tax=Sinisalibacter lacisalsi TaxID=1526570 RepID=A0ABQ1Q8V8_9RHOB|nr:3'-5' exonuclease [Sinisalibacter lacisalsi]GGD19483.1 hypothetical protein GCM10011358_00090 [Sinisalibacter lacisalsi]